MFPGIISVENPAGTAESNQVTDLFEEQIRAQTYGDERESVCEVAFKNGVEREYEPERERRFLNASL